MKVYREWRISGDTEWLRRLWPKVKTSLDYCIETWDPRPQGRRSTSRTTTPTTSSSGARTACARASTSARCRPPSLMGKALGEDGAALRGAARARAAQPHGDGAVERRVLHPEGRSGRTCGPGARSDTQSMVGELLARGPWRCWRRKGPSTSTATAASPTACSAPGWPRCAASAQVLDRGKVGEPPRARPPLQPQAGPVATTPTRSGPTLRLRRRGRPAALHLAQGRQALAAVRLQRRGLDRHRVPGRRRT